MGDPATAATRELRAAWHFGSFLPPETFTNVGTPDPDSARKAGLGAAPDPPIRPRRRFVGSATIRLGGIDLDVSHKHGELVQEVRLPEDLADHPLLREYYGTVA